MTSGSAAVPGVRSGSDRETEADGERAVHCGFIMWHGHQVDENREALEALVRHAEELEDCFDVTSNITARQRAGAPPWCRACTKS